MGLEAAKRARLLLQEKVDWDYLVRAANTHGVVPLVARNLCAFGPDVVPASVLDRFNLASATIARRNLMMTGELLRLLDLLASHGITAIPFKGAVLAATAYGDVALRQYCDHDVLVQKQDILKAKDLVVASGYRPKVDLTVSETAACLLSPSQYNFVLVSESGGAPLELHWGITEKYYSVPLDENRLWDRPERVPLGGRSVYSIAPEDLLLILSVHGSRHCWERLEWICDVAELIRSRPGIDWERVLAEATRLGSERMLFLGLRLVGDLLQTPLPEHVSRRVRADAAVQALAVSVRAELFAGMDAPFHAGETEISGEGIRVRSVYFSLSSRERLRDRTRYMLHLLRLATRPTRLDREFVRLPGSLEFLHYVLRPVRLLRVYGVGVFRHINQVLRQFVRGT